jgi:hypothetical protein
MNFFTEYRRSALLAGVLCLSLPLSAQQAARTAKGVIDGRVSDEGFAPIAGAIVEIVHPAIRVETGESGRFQLLAVPPGQYLVVVRKLGYRPVVGVVELPASDTVRIDYTLEKLSMLDTVRVVDKRLSPRMAEFEDRRRYGVGQFVTTEQIEKRNSVFATELVRTFTGLTVKMEGRTSVAISGRTSSTKIATKGGQQCYTDVYVDGVHLPSPVNLDDLPSPKDLAGIEYYHGPATAPLQFGKMGSTCGLLLIWTKDGS